MAKYAVSLAVREPRNWEVEVEANSEKEAVKVAKEMFEEDFEAGELTDTYVGDIELSRGVYVEKLTA